MTPTFLDGVLSAAAGKSVASSRIVRTKADLDKLSYYTLCALSDTMEYNPFGIEAAGETWTIDLDDHGNFLAARKVTP